MYDKEWKCGESLKNWNKNGLEGVILDLMDCFVVVWRKERDLTLSKKMF